MRLVGLENCCGVADGRGMALPPPRLRRVKGVLFGGATRGADNGAPVPRELVLANLDKLDGGKPLPLDDVSPRPMTCDKDPAGRASSRLGRCWTRLPRAVAAATEADCGIVCRGFEDDGSPALRATLWLRAYAASSSVLTDTGTSLCCLFSRDSSVFPTCLVGAVAFDMAPY